MQTRIKLIVKDPKQKSASVDNCDMFWSDYSNGLKDKSQGRLPWYDMTGQHKEAYVIGICGGSGSGKTTVASNISQNIKIKWITTVSLDSFYKVLSEEQHDAANRGEYDFDSPDAIDFKLAAETITQLKKGKTVSIPFYDFTTHSRLENSHKVLYGVNVIIIEGLMTFLHPEILKLLDMKIFVETDADLRLCRRIKRDIAERSRTLPSILTQYSKYVKPNFDKHIANLVNHADIVVPWSSYNYSAVDMIGKIIKQKLEHREFTYRSKLIIKKIFDENLLKQVKLIKQSHQVKILHTMMRDFKTERFDFCNVSRRLIRLALLESLSLIPVEDNNFEEEICTVSIMRTGGAFEEVVEMMIKNHKKGHILIKHNDIIGEPEFHTRILPKNIKEYNVLLFDAVIASGSSAIMALRVLHDHDVKLENIILISIIMTKTAVEAILNMFPGLKIVTTAIDDEVTDNYNVIPGCGDFGQRFYNC